MTIPFDASSTSLQLTARLEDLEKIRRFIEAFGKQAELEAAKVYDIDLAVTELVTNSLEHGYPDQRGWIEVELGFRKHSIVVSVRDQAPAFDPTSVPAPDRTLPLEKRGLGGMGIHLVRQMITKMEYRCLAGGGNETTLYFSPYP